MVEELGKLTKKYNYFRAQFWPNRQLILNTKDILSLFLSNLAKVMIIKLNLLTIVNQLLFIELFPQNRPQCLVERSGDEALRCQVSNETLRQQHC